MISPKAASIFVTRTRVLAADQAAAVVALAAVAIADRVGAKQPTLQTNVAKKRPHTGPFLFAAAPMRRLRTVP